MSQTFLDEIASLKKRSYAAFTKETVEELVQITNEMAKESLSKTMLREGARVPAFELYGADGCLVRSSELLRNGPLVVSFYRGGWCPFCSLELKFLQKIYPRVKKLGADIVAISPQLQEFSAKTKQDNQLAFSVLNDLDNSVAKQFGLIFSLVRNVANIYRINFNLDLKAVNGNEDYEFPIPATYVVKPDGVIHYAFIDVDYMKRLDPDVVLMKLEEIT